MSTCLRKISVGPDYKNAMHYVVGQDIYGGKYVIDSIIKTGSSEYEVWIRDKKGGIQKWKTLNSNMPVVEEEIVDPSDLPMPS